MKLLHETFNLFLNEGRSPEQKYLKTSNGRIVYDEYDDHFTITWVDVNKAGKGYGYELYSKIIDLARKANKDIYSDRSVDSSAVKAFWDRNHTWKNPNITISKRGYYTAPKGESVFKMILPF